MANYMQLTATAQVKVGAGKLYGIFISTTTGNGTLVVYDSSNGSTGDPKIANTINVAAGTTYLNIPNGLFFNNGLYIVKGGTTVVFTVVYE